jgi:hypothetical protein
LAPVKDGRGFYSFRNKDLLSIEEQLNVDDEIMSDYYYALVSLLYGPHWWAKPGCNLYEDLTTIQQVKFSRLAMSIENKNNGSSATLGDLWRFTNIISDEPHLRFMGKLHVIFSMLPRLLIMIGFMGLSLFGLFLVLLLVF